MPSDEAGGKPEEGWTSEEKSRGAAGSGDAGKAGEAEPTGRVSDDRAATEAAAMKIEQEKSEGQPS